jgi:hypothetical protein
VLIPKNQGFRKTTATAIDNDKGKQTRMHQSTMDRWWREKLQTGAEGTLKVAEEWQYAINAKIKMKEKCACNNNDDATIKWGGMMKGRTEEDTDQN